MIKRVAVMQPYLFPYIGYFNLTAAADVFVFYDDVAYIKQGWINRNKLLLNGEASYFTVPVKRCQINTPINMVEVKITEEWLVRFYKTLRFNYAKSPYFSDVSELVMSVLNASFPSISEMAEESVISTLTYVGLRKNIVRSSKSFSDNKNLGRAERLIDICKQLDADCYVNSIGGKGLYHENEFSKKEIELRWLKPQLMPYGPSTRAFVPGLSVIDLLMWAGQDECLECFNDYELLKD